MSSNIFISYRRDDSRLFCNYLNEALEERFNHLQIFLDKKNDGEHSILPGSNVEENIHSALDSAKIILVVIGENWGVLDQFQKPRIILENDWVRKEISYALKRAEDDANPAIVIPLWVGGASKIFDIVTNTPLPNDIQGIRDKDSIQFSNDDNLDLLESKGAEACLETNIEYLTREIQRHLGSMLDLFKQFLERDPHLSEKYDTQNLEILDQGSISTIFKTIDNHSKRDVVLKVLNSRDERIRGKFDRSAKVAVKLSDLPHFMTIYNLHLKGDFHFYSQQYINGKNLRKILRSQYPQGLEFSLIHEIMLHVGEALLKTHKLLEKGSIDASMGYVFCNIKPSNLMLEEATKEIFLSPFNLCLSDDAFFSKDSVIEELEQKQKELKEKKKNRDCEDCQDLFFEELAYLLPERVYSEGRPDPSVICKLADLYMMGLLAFELLTGQHPPAFQDFEKLKSDQENAYQEITAQLIDREEIPHAFQEIVLNIVKKEPYQRQEFYCRIEDAIRSFKNIDYFLNLAQESYKSCLDGYGDDFEKIFIEYFLEKLKKHEEDAGLFEITDQETPKEQQPAHIQLSFQDSQGIIDETSKIRHAKTLKESILFLFAYFEQSERFIAQEPNLLTRVAESHRRNHKISWRLYEPFKKALIDTMVSLDLEISDSENSLRSEKISQAWEHVVKGGFDYMIKNGSQ